MDRKLTTEETDFLLELRELMAKHSTIMYSENDRVCFDVDYSGGDDPEEPVTMPDELLVFYDIDNFIKQNS